jgi:hypothetical protein
MKLMKFKKKEKNYVVFYFTNKKNYIYIYLWCDYMGEKKKILQ